MTKKELVDDLKGKVFVDAITVEPLFQTETAGSNWYRLSFREIIGKAMMNRSIDFYVVDEGKPEERAYYKDQEPEQAIRNII